MKLATILVGVDFSDESQLAIDHAVNIARHSGARLVLLHVGVVPQPTPDVPASIQVTLSGYEQALKEQLNEDRRRLGEIRERISGQGVEVAQMIIEDFPDQGICRAADELDADLVVIGSHGRTGVKRLLLGSVAERVVRLSDRNVLVARRSAGVGAGGYRKILVAMDFSPTAEEALRVAMNLAAPEAQVDMLNCWRLPGISTPYLPSNRTMLELSEPLSTYSKQLGEKMVTKHSRPGLNLAFHSLDAPPAQGIVEWLDGKDYGLVITGSHGHRGLRRFLLGSVAEATVRHAPISVLVVHGQASAGDGEERS